MIKRIVTVLLLAIFVLPDAEAVAKKRHKRRKRKSRKREPITVPVDVGVGPTFNHFFGPVGDDQQFHYGLKLDVAAIITHDIIVKHKRRIPKGWRRKVVKMKTIKYRPYWWLPESIFISPKTRNIGVYGVTWRPVGLGISLVDSRVLHLGLSAGAVVTYAYFQSDVWKNTNHLHFFRPGVDLKAELVLQFSRSFLISGGWDSYFYPPQAIDDPKKGIFDLGKTSNSVWHNGQIFVMLHFRFPYTTRF